MTRLEKSAFYMSHLVVREGERSVNKSCPSFYLGDFFSFEKI